MQSKSKQTGRYYFWWLLNRAYRFYDRSYRSLHRLQAVDDFLLVKKQTYRGKARRFRDGTWLEAGDSVLQLHFNNVFMDHLHRRRNGLSKRRVAWSFGKAIVHSMSRLDQYLNEHFEPGEIKVITGVTWFKTHGDQIGFESYPLDNGWQTSLLRWHFRLLLLALFPQLQAHRNSNLQPHQFWLTPQQLHHTVEGKDNYVAQRFTQHNQPGWAV